jgi:hypothetical protein
MSWDYPCGHRPIAEITPVRDNRGDVHGDLGAVARAQVQADLVKITGLDGVTMQQNWSGCLVHGRDQPDSRKTGLRAEPV